MEGFEKLNELMQDEAFVAGLAGSESLEAAKAYLSGHGVELSDEEVAAFGKQIAAAMQAGGEPDRELTQEQLQGIAGGRSRRDVVINLPDGAWVPLSIHVILDKGEKAWDWITDLF